MPAFIVISNPQSYPPTTIPMLAPGVPGYMFGIRNDYRYGVGVVLPESLGAPDSPPATSPSLEFAVPSYAGSNSNAPALQWVVQYPTAPASVEVHLEGTLDILNGPWFQLAKSTSITGDAQTVNLGTSRVVAVRTNIISAQGSNNPTIISMVAI